ncbi:MAG: alpha/beta hydrolase [Pedococcus sp.]
MRRWLTGMVTVVALGGCGGAAEVASTSTRTPVPLPMATPTSIADRCKIPVEGGLTEFPAPGGGVMTGAVLGDGPVVAVLLHQTSAQGFCGFATYAAWLAEHGVRAVLVDLCGWGRAKCQGAFASDLQAQVRLPVDWARANGATRVTVVGASMGGALSLGFAQQAGADALVDLSGPAVWTGTPPAGEAAKATTIPLLLAVAPNDSGMDPPALRDAVQASPATAKRFISTEGGHGWTMLNDGTDAEPEWTPLADAVRDWVKGDYAA